MTFVLATRRLYWWPVNIPIHNTDKKKAGKVEKATFRAQFELLPTDEMEAIDDEWAAQPAEGRLPMQTFALLRVMKDWDGVVDEQNGAIGFTPELLEEACRNIMFRQALHRAYVASLSGEGARQGN